MFSRLRVVRRSGARGACELPMARGAAAGKASPWAPINREILKKQAPWRPPPGRRSSIRSTPTSQGSTTVVGRRWHRHARRSYNYKCIHHISAALAPRYAEFNIPRISAPVLLQVEARQGTYSMRLRQHCEIYPASGHPSNKHSPCMPLLVEGTLFRRLSKQFAGEETRKERAARLPLAATGPRTEIANMVSGRRFSPSSS